MLCSMGIFKRDVPNNNVCFRSFQSTFYIHSSLEGNVLLGNYCILYIEDERFFFEESNYDHRFWYTTKTYLIISENKMKHAIIWPYIQRIWTTFKVFKISLLDMNELRVLRIFDDGFYKYVSFNKLNYGINDVKGYPLKVVIFPRMPSIVYYGDKWIGPDWETLSSFTKRLNFTLKIDVHNEESDYGRYLLSIIVLTSLWLLIGLITYFALDQTMYFCVESGKGLLSPRS